VTRQSPTTIAILGDHPVAENALALLLEGSEYHTIDLQESPPGPPGLADGLLEGVDVLLLAPNLSTGARDTLLSGVRGNPNTAAMPVLMLSTGLGDAL
jgi:hypothetical protein